ncbi:CLOCK-interacting pacemaker [Larimichthys crocea]|uniref:Uncharacterized protein n=1 Tax=Larimichthys crocea TaxID=215358 RepID=A0ACD3QK38_LARCR|nr:CLOCK-interacting pacemaker [Larimichthys crocea]
MGVELAARARCIVSAGCPQSCCERVQYGSIKEEEEEEEEVLLSQLRCGAFAEPLRKSGTVFEQRSSMPKEQPCLSEHSLCAASSKNAKDKSNSTTLLAIRNTKDADHSSGQGSRCSSEKDSGYSDGSDWQQTDVEDQRSNKSQSKGSEHAETSQPGQNQEPKRENPGNSSAGRDLSPIYIINNMVLKQPDMIQKRVQLPQRNGSMETSSSGPAHMILLQQPSLLPATHQLHKPLSRKPNTAGKKINGTYLPILNSYPRIAPHPSKKPPDKSSLNDESQNLSKRVCTEHKREDTSVTQSLPEQHINKQPKLAALTSGLPCSSSTRDAPASSSPTTVSLSQGTQSGSSLCTTTTSSFLSTRGLLRNGGTNIRHRRFFNTVQILKQSGLLDITLRTKGAAAAEQRHRAGRRPTPPAHRATLPSCQQPQLQPERYHSLGTFAPIHGRVWQLPRP